MLSTTRYSGQILRKLEFSRQILEACSDTTVHQNSSGGNRVVPFGRTHRHDEANESLFAVLRMRVTVWQQAVAPPSTCLSYRVALSLLLGSAACLPRIELAVPRKLQCAVLWQSVNISDVILRRVAADRQLLLINPN